MTTILLMLGGALVGAAIGFAAGRRRPGGWEAAAEVLRQAAAGDLTGRVPAGTEPHVAAAVNGTLDRVAGTVRQVATASAALTDAGQQLGPIVEEMLTDDITRRIAALQSDTTGAVQAIGQITDVIGRVNGYQTTIARAVELQSSTTAGMSGSIGQAAAGAAEIADTMIAVARKRKEAQETVLRAKELTGRLDRLIADLAGAVGGFKVG